MNAHTTLTDMIPSTKIRTHTDRALIAGSEKFRRHLRDSGCESYSDVVNYLTSMGLDVDVAKTYAMFGVDA